MKSTENKNKLVKPYKCFKVNLTAGKSPAGFGKRMLLQVAEQPSVNIGVLSLYFVSEIIEQLFIIKICVTLNEG